MQKMPQPFASVGQSTPFMITICVAAVLVIGFATALLAVYRALTRKSEQLRLQAEKFRAIASHFDTLIFEYDPQRDHLTFTINSTPRFFMDRTEVEHCREASLPMSIRRISSACAICSRRRTAVQPPPSFG